MVERGRGDRELLVSRSLAFRRALVVADHAQHRLRIGLVPREGAAFGGDFRRGRVSAAGENGGKRGADRPAVVAVVRDAGRHEEPADVGVAEAKGAVVIGEARDLARRELRHRDRDFERQRPQANRVLVALDVERLGRRIAELQEVEGREIAGRVVEEHVFGARVRRADRPELGAGVPVVDGGVILEPRIGRGPGGVADLLPQVARLHGLRDLAVEAARKIPLAVGLDRVQEGVGQADRIVRVLARDGEIGLRLPVGVVGVEFERRIALAGELDDALDDAVRNLVPARGLDLAF